MATGTQQSIEPRILLHGIRWETYDALCRDMRDVRVPRMTYDQGRLELMSPSFPHEAYREFLSQMIRVWAYEHGIRFVAAGAATQRRYDVEKGAEPDASFYFANERHMRGRLDFDQTTDPPPDLVVEIDVSANSIEKLPVYAALGIPEVWLYNGESLRLHGNRDTAGYQPLDVSTALPGFPQERISHWLELWRQLGEQACLDAFREAIREND